jgi:L-alanine-DL-glutamate epimerase-like enolase superfamily enzyme
MIADFDFYRLEIPMVKEFRISLGSTKKYEGFLVRLRTDEGIEGWGEGVPTPFITGETMGSVEAALVGIRELVTGMNEASSEQIWEAMQGSVVGSYAAKCAIDTALWDIAGKRCGLPVSSMLGGYRERVRTSFTVDLGTIEEAGKSAGEFAAMGLGAVKVKLGLGIAEDYERVKVVRERIGTGKVLYVDFNQSYTPKKAVELAQAIHRFEVEFLEQPTPARDIAGLKFVREHSPLPVMADESVHGPEDVIEIVRQEAADMINLKLMKAGGITRGRKVVELAEAAGMPVMIGCMVETKIAVTAGTHLALGMRNVRYADLDGYTSLKDDVTRNGVSLQNGENRVSGKPGLGIEVDPGAGRELA